MDIASLYAAFVKSEGICTDTRNFKKGTLFFALQGLNFNGNSFAKKALEDGAVAVVIDDPNLQLKSKNVYLVDNALETLQALATYHRLKLKTPIIALTGSNGKTTTKELIRAVLSEKYHVLATEGNLNNHIGVPLTLLKLNANHQIGIIEMGANHPNEIAQLCEITLPDWGYITNFGKAHLEGFGGIDGVIRSKSEMYRHQIKHQKNILINADDYEQIKQVGDYNVLAFGNNEEADYQWNEIKTSEDCLSIQFQNKIYTAALYGEYNLNNIAAALTFAALFKVSPKDRQKGLSSYVSKNNRSQLIQIHQTQFILDAYNANPSSMRVALNAFDKNRKTKKAVILGDMKELGNMSDQEHLSLLKNCLELSINHIYAIGPNFSSTALKDDRISKFQSLELLMGHLESTPWTFPAVLIKGSRALTLEKLIPFFEKLLNP